MDFHRVLILDKPFIAPSGLSFEITDIPSRDPIPCFDCIASYFLNQSFLAAGVKDDPKGFEATSLSILSTN